MAQEAIALTIFGVFMVVVLGQPLGWRYVAAFGGIMAAVGFMFIGQ
ncbi:MAG: DMT family protein [Croceibacterium sp.]